MMIKIHIDKQSDPRRVKRYRIRVMRSDTEAVAFYTETRKEAERIRKMLRRLINALERWQ